MCFAFTTAVIYPLLFPTKIYNIASLNTDLALRKTNAEKTYMIKYQKVFQSSYVVSFVRSFLQIQHCYFHCCLKTLRQ